MKRPQQLEAIRLERHILYISGFYPLKRNAFFYTSRYITLTCSITMLLTMVIRMLIDAPDFLKVMETLHFSITQLAFIGKGIAFILRNQTLLLVEKQLQQPVFNSHTENQDVYIAWAIKKNKILARVFRIVVLLATAFYIIYPLIDNRMLPVPAWYPIDIVRNRYLLIAFQGACLSMNAYSNSTIDLMMTGLISMLCAQLDVLKDSLENATVVKETDFTKADQRIEDVVKKRIYKCAVHHEAILRVTTQVESIFSVGICFQFFAGITTICLTGFMMLRIDYKSIQFFSLVFYGAAIVNQIALSCWYGHDIMIRSEGIVNACYMNNWYDFGKEVRQGLFIIMERAKKPIQLTAGNVWILNLSTLVTIFRLSYSYYAVLRQTVD